LAGDELAVDAFKKQEEDNGSEAGRILRVGRNGGGCLCQSCASILVGFLADLVEAGGEKMEFGGGEEEDAAGVAANLIEHVGDVEEEEDAGGGWMMLARSSKEEVVLGLLGFVDDEFESSFNGNAALAVRGVEFG
jgi:hypothetical protein